MFLQAGIKSTSPRSNLEVVGNATNGSKPEGIIATRLTGDQIASGDTQYTANQTGAIVYDLSVVTLPSLKTANIHKKEISILDIIKLNKKINCSYQEQLIISQKQQYYDKKTIFEILEYQNLNNKQLSRYLNFSRNTVTKWKKLFYSSLS
ncbi:hypothetical protein KCF3NO3_34630 [Chryseobacterium sp. KCF3-3]